ncbi:MAG: NAD(P)-binding domain-containing protein [bacterium]
MKKILKVLVVGAGEIGTAIGNQLKKSKPKPAISFWDCDKGKIADCPPLDAAARDADVVFLCVPSFALRDVCRGLAPGLSKNVVIVSLTKGVTEEGYFVDAILTQELSAFAHGILGGPMLAEELEDGLGGIGTYGSSSEKARKMVARLFSDTDVLIETVEEPRSVALLGVLKNIYAVILSMASELYPGDNRAGYFTSLAFREIFQIVDSLGGNPSVLFTAAGIGDLIATSRSKHSRNNAVGKMLALGKKTKFSEGVRALPIVAKMLNRGGREFTLLMILKAVLGGMKPRTAFAKL